MTCRQQRERGREGGREGERGLQRGWRKDIIYFDCSDDKQLLYITCKSFFLLLSPLTSHYYELCLLHILLVPSNGQGKIKKLNSDYFDWGSVAQETLLSCGEHPATVVFWFPASRPLIAARDEPSVHCHWQRAQTERWSTGSTAASTQMYDTSHIVTAHNVFTPPPSLPFSSSSSQGGESIPVYPRLPGSLPANVRAALPRAVADTGPEGCLGERHNSPRPEEGHRLWD